MNKFLYEIGRRRECPVCGGERKDCRERLLDDGRRQIHCRSTESTNGRWRYIKDDASGFGIYGHVDDLDAWKSRTREQNDAIERKRRERAERARIKAEKLAAARLTEIDRDREIRKILDQLTLSEKDRATLLQRKYLEERHIENYRSIDRFQPLPVAIDPRLAGVNARGAALNNGHKGILIPIPNEDGLFVGLRIHDPNSSISRNGKYLWISSSGREVTNAYRNGENPIAVYYPEELKHSDKIGLCEGYEFKPQIAADRLGYPVIGLGGAGSFASSPKTLLKTIAALSGGIPRTLVLIPDANSPNNLSVWKGQHSLLFKLEFWKYPHLVAWWDQYEKHHGDIDEIPDIDAIRYIDPSKYTEFKGEKAPRPPFDIFLKLTAMGEPLGDILRSASKYLFRKGNKFFPYTKPAKKDSVTIKPSDPIPSAKELNGRRLVFDTSGMSPEDASDFVARSLETAGRERKSKLLFNNGPTGSGKSHTVGALRESAFYLEKDEEKTPLRTILYSNSNPRDPATAEIEKIYPLPTRSGGFVADPYKLTPQGNPVLYRPAIDDIDPSTLYGGSNCQHHKQFLKLRNNGQSHKGLCGTCSLFAQCQKGSGDGYGFLHEMAKSFTVRGNKRGSALSMAPEAIERQIFIADDNLPGLAVDSISATEKDLTRDLIEIIQFDPTIGAALSKPIAILLKFLSPEGIHKKYGYETAEVLEALGDLPENISELVASVKSWEDAKNTFYCTPGEDGKYPEPAPRWVSRFLEIWKSASDGRIAGAITARHGNLEVSIRNPFLREAYEVAHCSIAMDATASPDWISTVFGVPRDEMIWFSTPDSDVSNITIQPVDPGCKVGKDRSDDLIRRLDAIRGALPSAKVIDYGIHSRGDELNHFVDARGSNRFEGANELIIFGLPRPNIGAKLTEYICLTGRLVKLEDNDEDFARFYKGACIAELIQEIGRLRANRYPDQQFTIYVVDNEDLSELRDWGYRVNPPIPMAQITKEAATRSQATLWDMSKAIGSGLANASGLSLVELRKALKSITQKQIADLTSKSVARMKQLSERIAGGWHSLVESLLLLYESNIGVVDFRSELDKRGYSPTDVAFIESELLPLAAESNIGHEQDAFDDIELLLADESLVLFTLTPFQRVRFILAVLRKLFDREDIPVLMSLLAPESEFE
jgi:hypothetical protein